MSSTSRFLCAPLRGVVVPLGEVPDPAFAEGALGPGVAIDPLDETLHAPFDGEVIQCARTAHALTLRDDHGHEWLLHIGIDTVDLGGEGFELLVATGDRVSVGDPLCRFDVDGLSRRAKALVTPIVVTNASDLALETLVKPGTIVDKGEVLLQWQAPVPAAEIAGREVSTQASARGEATIAAAHGLHARPASRLRSIAQKHDVELRLGRDDEAGKDRSDVDGASVASLSALLNLGLIRGDRVLVTARGAAAQAAVDAAVMLLETPEHDAGRADVCAGPSVAPAAEATPGTLNGLSASPGLAVGPLVRYRAALPRVADTADDPERERRALAAAVAEVDADLERSMRAAGSRGQQAEADIFEAHRAWLDDPDLRASAESKIAEGASAGRAWYLALETEIQRLRGSGNALLAGRADDLHDLQRQVMQRFATHDAVATTGLEGAILVAREMAPSQFVEVAGQIGGLCLAGGGSTSHVSILARTRGLPCLVAMGDALLEASGERVCLDADRGRLELAPDERRLAAVEAEQARQRQRSEADLAVAFEPVTMRDGRHLHVAANIASGAEAQGALDAGADGVGLMRSEFLFLARQTAPDLAEQQAEYRAAVEAMAGRPVVVRLLDIGADKQLPYLALPATPNPALGERGARLWQAHPEMFDTQLDALLEAGRGLPVCEDGLTRLRLMVPMIADVGELRWVRRRLATRAAALGIERLPSLGAMVEVPTAALCAGTLAGEADFLSIGTNDLTQYALAMDREVASLAARSDVLHPGVLRLIALCLEGAGGRCPVAVCGTAAGDPLAGALLAAMGVDELSVEPARVAVVKATLRRLDAEALAAQLPALLALDDAAAVREALATMLASSAEAATPASGDATTSTDTTTRS
ncbi:phosphoenolpyruvate--protein phosphotransferase [Salinicola corii]|uniref:Phosphoenolpyruvate--protein phosphotransferase n=1 Tax=Salinicola corii TaxID=2606937 RepID=A0A640W862_9GAMM|nr:glucose PTS transporter subunit IIA [Salinicola corii]KAA0016232.1 phosphoenolpyruvate--protein phosphotransferase [Salinicola corii]